MEYYGEHLLPGQTGHAFIILFLVFSAVTVFSYYKSSVLLIGRGFSQYENAAANDWRKLGRLSFAIQSVSVLAIFLILIYLITNHYFEYKYVWQHSSRSLEMKYLLAAIWEGQEGSFLLWAFWNSLLGLIVMKTSGKREAPVMTFVGLAQFCLATMITGIYLFGWKMGSNPFILLRDSEVFNNAPAFHINFDVQQPIRPDYLSMIKDGNDLNPLLQNRWMVIHPPVLFLGFASTLIPFAFALAGLWTKEYSEWIKPALPWALFSAAALGTGIMLGAWWAYESLSFGGYWAWDPVENASLVPWMILIAGIHTLLIYKHTGRALKATFLFFILTFGFILYSTFLTRSGVLGDASVHSFTDEGMKAQLLSFIGVMMIPAFYLFFRNYKSLPAVRREEEISSREFWMFIGSLIFFFSAFIIIFMTSLPLINKIFGWKKAPAEDAEFSYNSIQIYIAILVAVLTGSVQYLKYKSTKASFFRKKIFIPSLISLTLALPVLLFGDVNYTKKGPVFQAAIWIAVACWIFSLIANASYILIGLKGKLKSAGGSVTHAGFAMVLLGILISSSKKEVISRNVNGIFMPVGENEDPRENLTLLKGIPVRMGNYELTYLGDSVHPKKQLWYYKIRFRKQNGKEDFVLTPNAFVNYKGNEGLMANPDARHYWNYDIFTYITSLPNPDKAKDTAVFQTKFLQPGDTVFYSSGFIVLQKTGVRANVPEELFGNEGKLYEATFKIHSKTGSLFTVTSRLAHAKGDWVALPDTIASEGLILQLQQVKPDNSIALGIKESNAILQFVTLKAYKFPFINLLWLGVAVTATGFLMSMYYRIRKNSLLKER
ncbi:MAG: cytochrome c biogenesis protein CcsA [Chitinophagaceae bacterium]|nr:cytochrome c biogenesis protein CcsA [Chitinophagaceae bacterium]